MTFEVDGEVEDFSHCHCSQCRRLHGAAYGSFAGVFRSAFRYSSGDDKIKSYWSSEKNERIFCGNCGSNIMVISNTDPDYYYLSMSAIDGDPAIPTAYHIWVASKAPWHDIVDDLKKYDEGEID
ncbi:MAG: GFA family protein [Woeseiaceae bacterium]